MYSLAALLAAGLMGILLGVASVFGWALLAEVRDPQVSPRPRFENRAGQ